MAKAKQPDRLETLDAWLERADRVSLQAWEQARGSIEWNRPSRPEIGVAHVIQADYGDMTPEQISVATVEGLLDYIFAEGPCLLKAAKRLYHLAYNVSPQHVWLMNQTALGKMLNEGRASFSARDIRVWEEWLERKGFFGSRNMGKKNNEARAAYSTQKKGNVCKRGGKRAQRRITVLRSNNQHHATDHHETN